MENCSGLISLSPEGTLSLETNDLKPQKTRFSNDWREGWFYLAADKLSLEKSPCLKFWQNIAKNFLTELCHLPEEQEFSSIKVPEKTLLNEWLLQMPPMLGGEYLSVERLKTMWEEMNAYIKKSSSSYGGIHPFLEKAAPKWQQVGKVCFHLGENKNDPNYPFAFFATYSTGFDDAGTLKYLPLKHALEKSFNQKDPKALIGLLTPVKKAGDQCPWVRSLIETGQLYKSLPWTIDKGYTFLKTVPELEKSGLSVKIPNWWKTRSRPQVSVTIGSKKTSLLGLKAVLDFNIELSLGEKKLSKKELQKILAAEERLIFLRGEWVEVNPKQLKEALDHWKKIESQQGEISFIDGMRLLAGAPNPYQKEQNPCIKISPGKSLLKLLQNLRDPSKLPDDTLLEKNLQATLRPYQKEGVKWLTLLSRLKLGGCLADDMGLGKTLQILSALLINRRESCPSLLIVPASLLGNWKQEAKRFTPSLKLFIAHPSEKDFKNLQDKQKFEGIDLVITTYSLVTRQPWLKHLSWNLLILDEAQAIKNQTTRQSQAIKALKSESRIALTGTPIENCLSDLWSLFDFVHPGLLGSFSRFKEYVKTLEDAPSQFEPLRKLVAPYILRRMKTDPKILPDLPEKIESSTYCHLTPKQAQNYQKIITTLKKKIQDKTARRAFILESLLRFKQVCNHPSQLLGDQEYFPEESGKFIRLKEICQELSLRQEKVLLFTQFSEIIPPLAHYLKTIFGKDGLTLHGKTPIKERKHLVSLFQNEKKFPFLVLSLKAGGTGLNLTEASHVIHFDRWWNPAVENQATDRAFRIGQKKNVQVHKFVTRGTIEEEIDQMILAKKGLANEILAPSEELKLTELSDEELLKLVSLDIDYEINICA